MSSNFLKLFTTGALLLSSSFAVAIPFSSFDTRSMAMGGAGVAVGDSDAAPLFNPALLSVANDKDKFSIILPTVGIRVADPDKLLDSVDKFQSGNYVNNLTTSVTNLNAAISNFNSTPNPSTLTAMKTAAGVVGNPINGTLPAVSTQLTTLSNKPITADGGVATVVGIPSKKLGVAFFANGTVATGGLFLYKDAATLTTISTQANCLANLPSSATPTDVANCGTPNFNTNTLQSGINFRGVLLSEFGFSLSREFHPFNKSYAFGITPKIVRATLFDALINVNNSNQSNVTGADFIAEYNIANFDLGAAKDYNNGWRTGFVIKNVIPYKLDFKSIPLGAPSGSTPVATGDTLTLNPQARLGVSHATSWSTVALDVDLTRNNPSGLEQDTQYIALGGELNAFGWAQIRAGYRADMVNSARNVTSVGLGLSPFGVHIDLAVAGNANELGASFQLGFRY
jgi:hypothetical protein